MPTFIRILVTNSPPDVIAANVKASLRTISTADKPQVSKRATLSATTCAADPNRYKMGYILYYNFIIRNQRNIYCTTFYC